jgi:hypothetical protein
MFIDSTNIFNAMRQKYNPGAKLDYRAYRDYLKDLGDIQVARVFVSELKNEASKFKGSLNQLGYEVISKPPMVIARDGRGDLIITRGMFNVELVVDILTSKPCDLTVIGTSDPQIIPVLAHIAGQVMILAAGIPDVLRAPGIEVVEIPESMIH